MFRPYLIGYTLEEDSVHVWIGGGLKPPVAVLRRIISRIAHLCDTNDTHAKWVVDWSKNGDPAYGPNHIDFARFFRKYLPFA